MHWTRQATLCCTAILTAFSLSTITPAQTNPFTKGQVADRIRKVEDGVDEFQKYLNNRGDDAKNRAESAQDSGATSRRQRTIRATPKTAGTKPNKQKTISKMLWTI
jgi:hypothetical protein